MSGAETQSFAVCWCCSNDKCPHSLSAKVLKEWDDMEESIDGILHKFDRKSIRSFLKRDINGNAKKQTHLSDIVRGEPAVSAVHRPHTALGREGIHYQGADADPMPGRFMEVGPRPNSSAEHGRKVAKARATRSRAAQSAGGVGYIQDSISEDKGGFLSTSIRESKSAGATTTGVLSESKSLPVLSPRRGRLGSEEQSVLADIKVKSLFPAEEMGEGEGAAEPGLHQPFLPSVHDNGLPGLPGDTLIQVGLMQVADSLARQVLPWQAVQCPRAVESLRDFRVNGVMAKHTDFVSAMRQQLAQQVLRFLSKKELEIDLWVEAELKAWQQAMNYDDSTQADFFFEDKVRANSRLSSQVCFVSSTHHRPTPDPNRIHVTKEHSRRIRETNFASAVDERERDSTREQLVNFRKMCRAGGSSQDVRVFNSSMEAAYARANAQTSVVTRDALMRGEVAHEWLCCLADNAVTAENSERAISGLFAILDSERERSLSSLHEALGAFVEQHNAIMDAIDVFAGKINRHAQDFSKREQLVSRAFLQYILSIISSEQKPHSSEHRRSAVSWEGKFIADRSHRKDLLFQKSYAASLEPFDKTVGELKERMHVQFEMFKTKMQSTLNGRDNDINRRKAVIQKRFSTHVNKSCNNRRSRMKSAALVRKEKNDMECKGITSLSDLSADLRVEIDKLWLRQHMRERRMMESAINRLRRLENSALIIWNKHSHLAITVQREQYEDWILMYRKDRDLVVIERIEEIFGRFAHWRQTFSPEVRKFVTGAKDPLNLLIRRAFAFDTDVSVEQNLTDLSLYAKESMQKIQMSLRKLRAYVAEYYATESRAIDASLKSRRETLVLEWRDNLVRLNQAVTRRIGTLKGMECDLEETIRLSLIQQETEAIIFEQMSCAKLEEFWIDWRGRLRELGVDLRREEMDKLIANSSSSGDAKIVTAEDAAFDDVLAAVDPEKLPTRDNKKDPGTHPSPTPSPSLGTDNAGKLTDLQRLKRIVDHLSPVHVRQFVTNVMKALEQLRRDHGHGPKRLVHANLIAQTLLNASDCFWDKVKMSERCVGQIASNGVLLFHEGLPFLARSNFCIGTAVAVLSVLELRAHCRIDCDDALSAVEGKGAKKAFLVGLANITDDRGTFGQRMLWSECAWMCCACGVPPPADLFASMGQVPPQSEPYPPLDPNLTASYQKPVMAESQFGFAAPDPLDLINSVLSVLHLGPSPRQPDDSGGLDTDGAASYERSLLETAAAAAAAGGDGLAAGKMGYEKAEILGLFDGFQMSRPIEDLFADISPSVSPCDLTIIAALLARADGMVDLTPNRLTQVVYFWRKIALILLTVALDPPGSEFLSAHDCIAQHVVEKSGKTRVGHGSVSCISPLEAVSAVVDWIISLRHIPLSFLQALALVSRAGACDPWLEDPSQNSRGKRFEYELRELVGMYAFRDFLGAGGAKLEASYVPDITARLAAIDVSGTKSIPLEVVRSFLRRDDPELSNAQISTVLWSLWRASADSTFAPMAEDGNEAADLDSSVAFEDHDTVTDISASKPLPLEPRPAIRSLNTALFDGDIDEYMQSFSKCVTDLIETMPTLDTNVIVGTPPVVLTPAAAHEIATMSVKLDPSARNPMPSSCCIWTGSTVAPVGNVLEIAATGKTIGGGYSDEPEAKVFGIPPVALFESRKNRSPSLLTYEKLKLEVDILLRYPVLCVQRGADEHYETGDAMADGAELLSRRLGRTNVLTVTWRDTMMTEWASSLYSSRQVRYADRAVFVKQAMDVYHQQYDNLKGSIIEERSTLLGIFKTLDGELSVIGSDEKDVLANHTSFLDRSFRQCEGQLESVFLIFRDVLGRVQQHCGAIKRKALRRIDLANQRLKDEMEQSCQGLISGYTGGYAQGYFDDMHFKQDALRKELTNLHGSLIQEKLAFEHAKAEIEQEATLQITDSITVDRSGSKGLLEGLNEDTYAIQEALKTTRGGYTFYQKDANARIVLKIESAVRESRKLRTAAEQQPELEKPVLAEIRKILTKAKSTCGLIVNEIKKNSIDQLRGINPLREPHREKMLARIRIAENNWADTRQAVLPLVETFEHECLQHVGALNARMAELIGDFRDTELKKLRSEYRKNRKDLILAFREHIQSYDLSEYGIFERFNFEVREAAKAINREWGDTRPSYFDEAVRDINQIAANAIKSASREIMAVSSKSSRQNIDLSVADDILLNRMELADSLTHTLLDCVDIAKEVPLLYELQRQEQVKLTGDMDLDVEGDFSRVQVVAVMDLIIAGVQIDWDYGAGYNQMIQLAERKCDDGLTELNDFYNRMISANVTNGQDASESIKAASAGIMLKIKRRDDEVHALLDASNAHIVADHSRLDVLIFAAEKDIDEWFILTTQLIDNAFNNAEESYLSDCFKAPPASPRLETIPEDEDRVAKLKALLEASTVQATVYTEPKAKKKIILRNGVEVEVDDGDEPEPYPSRRRKDESLSLQGGWAQCLTDEGFKYYFHAATGQSLWEIPEALKKPLRDPTEAESVLVTPRELVTRDYQPTPPMTPHRVEKRTKILLDPKVIMTGVAEEARDVSYGAVETAVEITKVIVQSALRKPSSAAKAKRVPRPAVIAASAGHESAHNRTNPNPTPNANQANSANSAGSDTAWLDQNQLDDSDLVSHYSKQSSLHSASTSAQTRAVAESRFREARECDAMGREERLCAATEAVLDQHLKAAFEEDLAKVLASDNGVFLEDVARLKKSSVKLKKASTAEVLAEKGTSWSALEILVFETLTAEEEARKLAGRLKTDQGRKRQKLVLEHTEDIEDMAEFFRAAGVGRTDSRKAATEAVLLKLSTPKRIINSYKRQELDLRALGLDEDDIEEVESMLKQLSFGVAANANTMSFNNINFGAINNMQQMHQTGRAAPTFTGGAAFNNQSMSTMSNFPEASAHGISQNQSFYSAQQQQQQQQFEPSASQYSNYSSAQGVQIDGSNEGSSYNLSGSMEYHPAYLSETVYSQQQDHSKLETAHDQEGDDYNYSANAASDSASTGLGQYPGFKSFHDNWIECVSDEGHTYYYNTKSNESSWTLPTDRNGLPLQVYSSRGRAPKDSPENIALRASVKRKMDDPSLRRVAPNMPRELPVPTVPDVAYHSKQVGVQCQLTLLNAQESFQTKLNETKNGIAEQKATYIKSKEEMFEKVTQRVDSRLHSFVDDVKYMQRTLKKEMTDLESSERDLRRLFDDQSATTIKAEKLAFILEGLERLKVQSASRYDGAFKQLEKFYENWHTLKSELTEVGNIYDQSVSANLEQVVFNCADYRHSFVTENLNSVSSVKATEISRLRWSLHDALRSDHIKAEKARDKVRQRQAKQLNDRELKRKELLMKNPSVWGEVLESQLERAGHKLLDPSQLMKPEEEIVMSYMLRQIEMEFALNEDYDSVIATATKLGQSLEIGTGIFIDDERKDTDNNNSWYNKHTESIKRHENALMVTLQRVRNKVTESFGLLNAKLESLDYEVEVAAEVEVAGMDVGDRQQLSSIAEGLDDQASVSQMSQFSSVGHQSYLFDLDN